MVTFSDLSLERPCPYCVTNFIAFTLARAPESILIFRHWLLVISALTPLVTELTAQLNTCILKLDSSPPDYFALLLKFPDVLGSL